jgi:hypothetical protein
VNVVVPFAGTGLAPTPKTNPWGVKPEVLLVGVPAVTQTPAVVEKAPFTYQFGPIFTLVFEQGKVVKVAVIVEFPEGEVAVIVQVPEVMSIGWLLVFELLLPQPPRTRAMPVRHRSRIPTDREIREFMFILLKECEAFNPAKVHRRASFSRQEYQHNESASMHYG